MFFGVDNTLLSRALDNGLFTAYEAKGLDRVPAAYQLDRSKHRVTPIDSGDICVNYDKEYFADKKLAPPQTFDDLVKPAYKNLLVTENAATSSPGLGFLLGSAAHVRRRRLAGLLEEAQGQRRQGRRQLGAGLQRGVLRLGRRQEGQGRPAAGRLLRLQPARRGALRQAAARTRPRPVSRPAPASGRSSSPGCCNGAKNPAGGKALLDFLHQQAVPGGHAAEHVRQPGA